MPERPVLGISDIADALEMSRSTTRRYVITLVALGCLEQGASRKYRLGLRGTDLGRAALECTGIPKHSHPLLEELHQRTGYATSVALLDGTSIRYVDSARSFGCERSNTITSEDALAAELDKICGEGLAVNDQELAQDLYAISTPVRSGEGVIVAAISLAAHRSTISPTKMVDALGSRLFSTANRISASIAGLGGPRMVTPKRVDVKSLGTAELVDRQIIML